MGSFQRKFYCDSMIQRQLQYLREYLIQRAKVFSTTYTNIQKNHIKENKINPIDFTPKHNVFMATCRLEPKGIYIQCQEKCYNK